MPPSNTADLSSRVDQLLQQRQQHLDAAEQISATIEQIAALLGTASGVKRRGRPPGRPRVTAPGAKAPAPLFAAGGAPSAGPRRRGRRRRQRFGMSGEESIINYIRSNRDATTQDLKKHWASE